MKQVMNLRTHIECGCLSNIEPSGGTNYNEALHRHINPHFIHAGRIRLHLAYALLTILFYSHNCKKSNSRNSLTKLIASKFAHTDMAHTTHTVAVTPFGIVGKGAHQSAAACDPKTSSDSSLTLANDHESLSITSQQMDKMVKNALSLTQLADYTQQVVRNSQVFSYHIYDVCSQSAVTLFTFI